MSSFSELDPLHIQKIFEVYQLKDFLSYTDSLRICASLKVFPDLLTSQEIRKIFVSLATGGSEKMTYAQFEVFLKIISKQVFRHCKKKSEDCSRLISYIKAATSKQFSINSTTISSKTLQNPCITQKSSNNSLSTPRNTLKTALFQNSEKSLNYSLSKKSSSKLFIKEKKKLSLLSPVMKKCKEKIGSSFSILTERRNRQRSVNSVSPSVEIPTIDKVSELFSGFQESIKKITKNKFKAQERLKQVIKENHGVKTGALVKLTFNWWRLLANEMLN